MTFCAEMNGTVTRDWSWSVHEDATLAKGARKTSRQRDEEKVRMAQTVDAFK